MLIRFSKLAEKNWQPIKSSMILTCALVVCCISTFTVNAKNTPTPTTDEINRWMEEDKRIEFENDLPSFIEINKIKLKSGEIAFIASVEFYGRGNNFCRGYVLVRPDLKKAVEVEGWQSQGNKIYYLDDLRNLNDIVAINKNIKKTDDDINVPDLFIMSDGASGSGYYDATQTLVSVDGWNIIEHDTIYHTEGNSGGSCGYLDSIDRTCKTIEEYATPMFDGYGYGLEEHGVIQLLHTRITTKWKYNTTSLNAKDNDKPIIHQEITHKINKVKTP